MLSLKIKIRCKISTEEYHTRDNIKKLSVHIDYFIYNTFE